MSSTKVTQVLNLEKHLKTCVHPNVFSPKATTNISKVSMVFFLFEANCDTDMLFFQFCHFVGIPKLKMEQHMLALNEASLTSHICYNLIPS
jgi:hypothetical protein